MKYTPKLRLPKLNYKKLLRRTLTLAALLLVISGYIAYTRLYLTPERRFWMAINNNLSTPSVVRSTETGGTGNKSTELTRFVFGAQAAQDKVSSVGFKNATTESNVTTETITTPVTQYVRYNNIFSTEKKSDGSSYNFNAIKNVWAKEPDAKDAEALNTHRLTYAQPLITLAPFGNLTSSARQAILADMKAGQVYETDFNHVTYQNINGEKYVIYAVKVQTKKYVSALQRYFTAAGFGSFPPLDPSGYSDKARVNAQFIIAMKSNTLAAVNFNDRTESYNDFGVTMPVSFPSKTISVDVLQGRLQAAQ